MSAGVRLLKDTTLYTLGLAVARFANLLLLPLYLSVLSREQYGVLGVCEQLVNVLVMLTAAGGMETLVKIGSDLRDDADAQRRLVATMTSYMVITGIVIAGVCALAWPLLGAQLGGIALWPTGALALAGVAGAAAFQALSAHLQFSGEARRHTTYAALRTGLNVAIGAPLLVWTDLGVHALLVAAAASYWIGAVALVGRLPPGFGFGRVFDVPLLRRSLAYGVPLLPHLAASLALQSVDKFMLAGTGGQGLEVVGVYSVAARIASGVMMLGLGMQRAWLPFFFREVARTSDAASAARAGDDHDTGLDRVRRLSFWNMAAMASAVAGLALVAPELVALIAPPGYGGAVAVTGVLCIATLLRTGAQLASSVVLHDDTRAQSIWLASVPAAALNVALSVVLIPRHGSLGAAAAVCVAMALNLVASVLLARRIRRVPFRYGAIAALIALVTLVVLGSEGQEAWVRWPLVVVVPVAAAALDGRFVLAQLRRFGQKLRR
jgi:O-antigen/teichoic acid export membrane protein